MKMTKRHSK